jgi:hypothetical protein
MKITVDFTYANLSRLRRSRRLRRSEIFVAHPGDFGPFLLSIKDLDGPTLHAALTDESLAITDSKLKRAALWEQYVEALRLEASYPPSFIEDSGTRGSISGYPISDTIKVLCWHSHLRNDYFLMCSGGNLFDAELKSRLEELFSTNIVSMAEFIEQRLMGPPPNITIEADT